MKIIIIILLLWFVLDRYYSVESYITKEQEEDLEKWFDLASELKTEISCIENFA
jgi:hypothetical protein